MTDESRDKIIFKIMYCIYSMVSLKSNKKVFNLNLMDKYLFIFNYNGYLKKFPKIILILS